jgi:arginyl-tRNA synthetase
MSEPHDDTSAAAHASTPEDPADLLVQVARAVVAALPEAARGPGGLSIADVAAALAPPPKAELGDLAFGCFPLAKILRGPPPKFAADLADALTEHPLIASARATGPYLNVTVDLPAAAAIVVPTWARGEPPLQAARDEKVMVEYSQPNTHKAFHVGHMRNLCLGDALVRLLRAAGHEVVAANYLGDVGTHIAKCLWGYFDLLSEDERVPPESGRGEWIGTVYSRASNTLAEWEEAAKAGDADAQVRFDGARARMTEILQGIETRDPEVAPAWRETRQWSLDEFDEIYAWCRVHFDRVFYESEVDEPGLELVEEYLQRGVFEESEGAVGIVNEEVKHMPFFMLRKRDGTSLYSTKDLALARMKFDEFGIDRSIYVVDVRQSDHFRHVFLTLKKMGFTQADRCHHVAYEVVELPSGAMSGRKGTVVLFRALRETMTQALLDGPLAKYRDEWSEDERQACAHDVALGAIKYGMLARDVNQKVIFDMQAWLQFEGNTGPYLQYAATRTASILRKAAERGKDLDPSLLDDDAGTAAALAALEHSSERGLIMAIAQLPAVVVMAADTLRPSAVCTYLFTLAKAYSAFNRDCHVLNQEGDLLQARLLLVKATHSALTWGLGVLGIPAPARM